MKILNLKQGTPEWHRARLEHLTASEAPRMMGAMKDLGLTRSGLLHYKLTGVDPDRDDNRYKQRIFDEGHRLEGLALPQAEKIVQDQLFPATGVREVEVHGRTLPLLASFDGLTMDYTTSWEHKTLNNDLREAFATHDLPPKYFWQLEQQLLVSGAERALFTASTKDYDGTIEEYLWYGSLPERRQQLLEAWFQFMEDLDKLKSEGATPIAPPPPSGNAPDEAALPVLKIDVSGEVRMSNAEDFDRAVATIISDMKTELVTDQDFADATKNARWCQKVEDTAKHVKKQVIAQIASINELFNHLDHAADIARDMRLKLSRQIKSEKTKRKTEAIDKAGREIQEAIRETINDMMKDLDFEPMVAGLSFQDITDNGDGLRNAIHGLKSMSSIEEALRVYVADAKTRIRMIASDAKSNYLANAKTMVERDATHLFPDFASKGFYDNATFLGMIEIRKSNEAAAKEEREKIIESGPDHVDQIPMEARKKKGVVLTDFIEPYIKASGMPNRTAVTVRKHLKAFLEFVEEQIEE